MIMSLFRTGLGSAMASGPSATPSESNNSGEKSSFSRTVSSASSVVSNVGSLTEVVTHRISWVSPAEGCPSWASGTLTLIGSGRNCRRLSGSSVISEDWLLPMCMVHRSSVSQLTVYWVGPLPVFLMDREKTAKSPGSAPNPSVPATMVYNPSTLSTIAVSLMLCETVGALVSNRVRSETKVPGRAYTTSEGLDRSVSMSDMFRVTTSLSPSSPYGASVQGPDSLISFHHSS